ncbi:aldehyde dehydrogenase family 3 member H1-like, partial [Trifolium medium]|nr:aldehyde dehydrogenase family 3 member H1-like [Trifolium medium]
VNKLEESFDFINEGTKPLAAYLFTNDNKFKEEFVKNVSAGGDGSIRYPPYTDTKQKTMKALVAGDVTGVVRALFGWS